MSRMILAAVVVLALQALASPAPAQAPAPGGRAAQPARPAAAPQPARPQAGPPRDARRPRSYAACNAAARQLGLRGAERRRAVARCQLGYDSPITKP